MEDNFSLRSGQQTVFKGKRDLQLVEIPAHFQGYF